MVNSDGNKTPDNPDSQDSSNAKPTSSSEFVEKKGDMGPIEGTITPMQDSESEEIIDTPIIGKYQIQRTVGRGGMGIVYLGLNPDTEGLVAIKTLPGNLAQTKLLERFKREARLAAKINHHNAVRILDAGYDEVTGKHFIVTEYIDGEDLEKILSTRDGKLPWPEVVGIVKAVAKALKEAAKHGIVHRDIKPANIMLANNGTVKLTDLGVAKQMDVDSQLTIDHQIVGTPAYISPEQIQSPRDVDTRSDIYSLGATFFHLLTGSYPFAGTSHYDTMRKIVSDPTPDVCEVIPEIPVEVKNIICKMMAKDPDERYQTIDELLDALYSLQPEGGTPTVMTTLIGGTNALQNPGPTPSQGGTRESESFGGNRSPKHGGIILASLLFVVCIIGIVYFLITNNRNQQAETPHQFNSAELLPQRSPKTTVNSAAEAMTSDEHKLKSFTTPDESKSTGPQVEKVDESRNAEKYADSPKNREVLGKKADILRQSDALQHALDKKSVMLDSKSAAGRVDAIRWAESTYELGLSAEQHGKTAFYKKDYEAAMDAYVEANNYFRLSAKEAESKAAQEADKKRKIKELDSLKASVQKMQQRMLVKKRGATEKEAESLAEDAYQAALDKEEEADVSADKGTHDSFLHALNAYSKAAALYDEAIDQAKRQLSLRNRADSSRKDMLETKTLIHVSEEVKRADPTFRKAQSLESTGLRKYQSANYVEASELFTQARNLYAEAIDQINTAKRSEADAARVDMKKVKETISPGSYSSPAFQEASQTEYKGNDAYGKNKWDKAHDYYQSAKLLYQAVQHTSLEKNIAKADKDVAQNHIDGIVQNYKNALESRDIHALKNLLNFSKREERTWKEFFENTINLSCKVGGKNIEIKGTEAKVELQILLTYMNKRGRKWQNRNFPVRWTLSEKEGRWIIVSR